MIKLFYIPEEERGGGDDPPKKKEPHVLYLPPDTEKPLNIKDIRKNDFITGHPISEKNNLSYSVSPKMISRIIKSAKENGVDPYTALAVAYQESGIKSDPNNGINLFGALGHGFDRDNDPVELGIKMLKDKLNYGKRLGKKTESEILQAYNGYGKLKYDEKNTSHHAPPKQMYGLDISHGIDFAKNPIYGKRVIDIRDNILKKNPEIAKMVEGHSKKEVNDKHQLGTGPPDIGIDTEEGEGPNKKIEPPKGYNPLTIIQRKNWNDFLDYLQKEGIGGSKELDKRDQTLGLNYLNKYNKENPDKAIDPGLVDDIQYEQFLIRKGDQFPGLSSEQLKYVRSGLNPSYMSRPVSDVDSWLGSLTSRQYYPTAHRGTNTGESYDFGVDLESYVKSLTDSKLAEKYKTK